MIFLKKKRFENILYFQETLTHTIRSLSTSDVWVTSAVQIPVFVTQYSTTRKVEHEQGDTKLIPIITTSTKVRLLIRI